MPPVPSPTAVALASHGADVAVVIDVQTPLITNCWLWAKAPGDDWQQVGASEIAAAVAAGTHRYTLKAPAASTEVIVNLSFLGPVGAPVNASVSFEQGGAALAPSPIAVGPLTVVGNAQAAQIHVVLT